MTNSLENDILERYKNKTLLSLLVPRLGEAEAYEQADVIAAVIRLHNAGSLDFLSVPSFIGADEADHYEMFQFQQFFCQVLPELVADTKNVLDAVGSLMTIGGRDTSATIDFNGLRDWCSKNKREQEILDLVPNYPAHKLLFLTVALQAGALHSLPDFVSRSVDWLKHAEVDYRRASLIALSAIRLEVDLDLTISTLAALLEYVDYTEDDGLLAAALATTINLHSRAPGIAVETVVKIIDRTRVAGGKLAHSQAAQMIVQKCKNAHEGVQQALLVTCYAISPSDVESVGGLDFVAYTLTQRGKSEQAEGLVRHFIERGEGKISAAQFGSFFRQYTKNEKSGAMLLLAWLGSESYALRNAAQEVVGTMYNNESPIFDVDVSSQSSANAVYLARKVVGYLFIYPITAASLLMCILKTCDDDDAKEIAELLFDPLLLNFSGSIAEYLGQVKERGKHPGLQHVSDALSKLEQYISALSKVGVVNELAPSERQRFIERHQRQHAMEAAYKAMEEKSIFRTLASRSVILHGRRTINYITDLSGNSRRSEIDMHTISHRSELPRMSIFDPTELEHQLFVFRTERRQ
ncbi:hypothetical protein BLA50215_00964 [Burkholderia lata]|uniref:hypothetical protein n=1 Tax=Burkholderia lata (strain ATCC 17760 / DSM 23089 / LMG 22485 / NCIMB 9086 / R18194 / 383) TaxID=482957 RepID=UPI0014544DD5|nr:hypothetical protein [Burkholderia lata]VWC77107.1 hypothetical protein BLA50215_00964 [Burkholderia lata]